ncbi:MAG: hypothetical protein V4696_00640 [Pseudomonadota bacterium]
MRSRRARPDYSIPGVDSARAVANAALWLAGARTIDGASAETLARQYHLKTETAGRMLEAEQARRAAQ